MTRKKNEAGGPVSLSRSIVTRLSLGGAGLLLIFGAIFLTFHYRQSRDLYRENTEQLMAENEKGLKELSSELLHLNRQVVLETVKHVTELYRHRIQGLPFELYRGGEQQLKNAIIKESRDLNQITQQNTDTVLSVLQERLGRKITSRRERNTALAGKAQEDFFLRFRGISLLFVSLSTALLAVGLGLGLFFLVLRPVRALREGTQRISAGELDFRINLGQADELGLLAADFNHMTAEVEELSIRLEQKVAERTNELRCAVTEREATIKELRSTQQQLIRAEKVASVGRLAGGVAHEFGNLLGGILGCADLAREAPNQAEAKDSLEMIYRTARRAQAIVDSLLRFARRRQPEQRTCYLHELVEDTFTLLAKEISTREVLAVNRIDKKMELTCDPGQISQILVNLSTNALYAMAPGGQLTISGKADENGIMVKVEDSGQGIPPTEIERIFEPFFTTRDGGDAGVEGTGLGLSVTLGIVEDHGGTINVESQPGKGTAFYLRFPPPELTSA